MTTTSVSDAIVLPQSQGTGLSGEFDVVDAALTGLLNRYVGGEYVAREYANGLSFGDHDGTNDTVDIQPGACFIQDNSTSTSGNRGSGGNPQAESTTTSGYDTELPEGHTYLVLIPTAVTIDVTDSTLNEVFIDMPDVTANNSVNIEHDGSTTASPGNTSLKIGETNPDDASADARVNDLVPQFAVQNLDVRDVDEDPIEIDPATSPVDINVDTSNWWQPISLTENVDVNLNGASTGGNSLLVYFEDGDGAGPYTLTWPASVVWSGGSAITEVPQNGNQRISLTSPDGGTTWYAVDAGGGFA